MYGKHRHTFFHILKENSSVRLFYLDKSSAVESKHTNIQFLTQFLENHDCLYLWLVECGFVMFPTKYLF